MERTLYGDDDSSTGLSSRVKTTETTITEIADGIRRIMWLLITAIVIAVLSLVIRPIQIPSAAHQSTSVITGQKDAATAPASAKTWLTTTDVAQREKVTERTVINYIESGQIQPPPIKAGKEWHIAENFRIIPKDAESCGNN
jgi:lipopolysaccharide/colanic/teichoic acid biosynthesis glycosyltransferase